MFTTWNKTLKSRFFLKKNQLRNFTFDGSLKSGNSRKSTADKPRLIQIIDPSNKKHHEYFTINVEYLENKFKFKSKLVFYTNP